MRIYEGSPRQDYEEVFRSIGAVLDRSGMREILLTETEDGFLVQGLVVGAGSTWGESFGRVEKATHTFSDDDIGRFMDEALARRGTGVAGGASAGSYERSLRVVGRYIDQQRPRDVFLLEQEGAFVLRLLMAPQGSAPHHVLVEFTPDDVAGLIGRGPTTRAGRPPAS